MKKSARKRTEKVVEVQVSVEPATTRTSNRVRRQEGQYTEMSDQHINQVSAQSIDSITAEEAAQRIRNLDKWPTALSRPVVSNHRFEYYTEGKTKKQWKCMLVSCDCSEGGCDKKTTINLGWCSEHLHMRKKITTGMSLQGANAGYGQFATATEHSKVGFTSVVFCETAVVLVFDELMEYTSHAERMKRYGFNIDGTYSTGTYAAAREVRAKTGEGFLPHENWDESRRDSLEVHAIYMDGARTRNPASLINRPSEGRTAN